MGTVTVLRALSRRRRSVMVVAIVAVLIGALVYFKLPSLQSRAYTVGTANVNILLDTPNSQVVEVAPRGSDTLGVRATLLANLMVDGVVKTSIAQAAGINPNDLAGISNVGTDPTQTGPTNPRAPQISTDVVTDANGLDLPIIEVTVQSTDAGAAVKLANASVTGLRNYLASKAAEERIPDAQRLQVTSLGIPSGTDSTQGPGLATTVIVMILVFCLGCAGLLGVAAVRRNWRAAAEAEARGEPEGEHHVAAPATPATPATPAAPAIAKEDPDEAVFDWLPEFSSTRTPSDDAARLATGEPVSTEAVPVHHDGAAHQHATTVNGRHRGAPEGSPSTPAPDEQSRGKRRRIPHLGRS